MNVIHTVQILEVLATIQAPQTIVSSFDRTMQLTVREKAAKAKKEAFEADVPILKQFTVIFPLFLFR